MESSRNRLAAHLWRLQAVSFSPEEPFLWSSGVRSPVYCDNRRLLSDLSARDEIVKEWVFRVRQRFAGLEAVAGVATAGIPHATLLADRLRLPLVYARPDPKDHGLKRAVEGQLAPGARTLVVEDLVSTGRSLSQVIHRIEEAQGHVVGATAIMTYNFGIAQRRMEQLGIPFLALMGIEDLLSWGREQGYLAEAQVEAIRQGLKDVENQLAAREASVHS